MVLLKNQHFMTFLGALGVSKDSSFRLCPQRLGQDSSRMIFVILYQVPQDLAESRFLQKWLRTHPNHQPSLWSSLPAKNYCRISQFLSASSIGVAAFIYIALPQTRTKGHRAIYTVIERSLTKVPEENSQVNITEMSVPVTSVAEFI